MVLNYPVVYKVVDPRGEATVASAINTAVADAEAFWAPEKYDGVFLIKGFGIKRLQIRDLAGSNANGTSIMCWTISDCWSLSAAAAETWGTVISGATLSDSAYVVLTGLFNYDGNPDVEALKITADGIEYPVMDIIEMYGWDTAIAYLSHPIVVRPEKKITIEWKCRTAGVKNFGFLGYTIAKRSYLIGKL